MNNFISILIAFFLLPVSSFAAGNFGEKKIEKQELVDILSLADIEQLNKLKRMSEAKLRYRLFGVPKSGTCVPETHAVCSYHYFLSVSEMDDAPERAVYDLGEHGAIIDFSLGKNKGPNEHGSDVVYFNVLKYPVEATKLNKDLKQEKKLYGGPISPKIFGVSHVPQVK